MKQKFFMWLAIIIAVGIAFGAAFNNIRAGICLSIGVSAVITLLLDGYNNESR